jgi:hypothetical protein
MEPKAQATLKRRKAEDVHQKLFKCRGLGTEQQELTNANLSLGQLGDASVVYTLVILNSYIK